MFIRIRLCTLNWTHVEWTEHRNFFFWSARREKPNEETTNFIISSTVDLFHAISKWIPGKLALNRPDFDFNEPYHWRTHCTHGEQLDICVKWHDLLKKSHQITSHFVQIYFETKNSVVFRNGCFCGRYVIFGIRFCISKKYFLVSSDRLTILWKADFHFDWKLIRGETTKHLVRHVLTGSKWMGAHETNEKLLFI